MIKLFNLNENTKPRTLFHITTRATVSPVQSGIRATKYGYKEIPKYIKTGKFDIFKSNDKPIYSGVFFDDGTHMTYNFNPGNPLIPTGIKIGDKVDVEVVGIYSDPEIECLVVTFQGETHQP